MFLAFYHGNSSWKILFAKLRIRFILIGCPDDGDIKEKLVHHRLFRTIDPEWTR